MRARVVRCFTFAAAHHLPWHEGRCRQLHGHTYRLEVTVEGPIGEHGVVVDFDEVRALARRPEGISRTARQAPGYREPLAYVEKGTPLAGCVEAAVRSPRRSARRQWAWFRRDPRLRWVQEGEDAEEVLGEVLAGARKTSPVLGGRR